jgi:hypothetical protein
MIDLFALVCKFDGCNLIYENPAILLCGSWLCKHHLEKLDEKFKCYFCDKEHETPENGFSINKLMIEMINSYY